MCEINYFKWLLMKPKPETRLKEDIVKQYERMRKILNLSSWDESYAENENDEILILPRFVISVTNKCSLRCKDCNNLMPYFKEKYDMEINELLKDIDTIFQFVDKCIVVEIIGGEPFLYQNFDKIMERLLNNDKVGVVEVTTNGTIFPRKEWIALLRHPKCYIMVSDYGKVNEARRKELISYFKQEGINYEEMVSAKWIDTGDLKKRNKSMHRLKWEYYNCWANIECRTLWKGKLFTCGRAPGLYELGKAKGPTNYLDVRSLSGNNVKEGKQIIRDFYLSNQCECCDYCDYARTHPRYVPNGIQLK